MGEVKPFEKLPKRVRSIIEKCRSGETLCLHLRTLRDPGDANDWFFEPSGRKAPPKSSVQAVSTPYLIASGDGLFDETSQAWTAAP